MNHNKRFVLSIIILALLVTSCNITYCPGILTHPYFFFNILIIIFETRSEIVVFCPNCLYYMGPAKEKKGPLQYFVKFLVLVILHSNFTYFLSASSNLIGLEFKTSLVFSRKYKIL